MLRQCTIIFGCLAVSELIVSVTRLPLPSSIIGMVLLTTLLKTGWIKLAWVKDISDFMLQNIAFFFVPSGVAIMLYLDILEASVWPIVIASVASTIITLTVTGWVHQTMRKKL